MFPDTPTEASLRLQVERLQRQVKEFTATLRSALTAAHLATSEIDEVVAGVKARAR